MSVQENSPSGTTVLTTNKGGFAFQDEDSNQDQYVCSLEEVTSSYVLDHFRVDRVKSECYLVAKKIVGYTKENQFQFNVTATNKDFPSMKTSCSVVLRVVDVNNYAPVFTQDNYWVTVSSVTPVDTSILTVSAVDLDLDVNGQVSYQILAASNNEDTRYSNYFMNIEQKNAQFISRGRVGVAVSTPPAPHQQDPRSCPPGLGVEVLVAYLSSVDFVRMGLSSLCNTPTF